MPLFSTLVDDFNDGNIDTTLWSQSYGALSESGGRLGIPSTTGWNACVSGYSYTLVGSSVFIEVFPAAGTGNTGEAWTNVQISGATNSTRLVIEYRATDNQIRFSSDVDWWDPNGVVIPYDATAMKYWRFRENSGTLYYETAPDAATWTVRHQIATPTWVTGAEKDALRFAFETHQDAGESIAYYDNVNVAPAAPEPEPTTGTPLSGAVLYLKRSDGTWLSTTLRLLPIAAVETSIPVFPTVRSRTTATHSSASGTATGETIAKPDGVVSGDLLVLYTVVDSGALADITVPTGFTQLGELSAGAGNVMHSVAYKVAGTSEPTSYTYANFGTSGDGASVLVAVKDWDGDTANLVYAQTQSDLTARAVPSATPKKTGLALYSAHHDNNQTATEGVWNWQPPEKSVLVAGRNNDGKWSSLAVAAEVLTTADAITGRTWADADITPTAAALMTSVLTIGAGTATATALPATKTGGSNGSLTDQTFVTFNATNGITSQYNVYAGGLDWTKDVGILIYTDGSAENGIRYPTDRYVMAGDDGMIATAKKHNMILLTPFAPGDGCTDGDGVCWYMSSLDGTTAAQKLEWSRQLISFIFTQYDIDKSRVAIGGYSSGAQWTTQFFGPAYAHEYMTDGVAVAISYGGDPAVTVNNTTAFKTHVPFVWNVGELDLAWTGKAPTYSDGVEEGHQWYTTNGYTTVLDVIPGLPHERYSLKTGDGEFGRIMDHYITRYVRPTAAVAAPVESTYVANPSGGTVNQMTDVRSQSYSDGTVSSLYHRSAAHLSGDGPFPLVLHLHGDGYQEYTNMADGVTTSVAYEYEKIAKNNGALFVLPRTPDTTNGTWYTLASSGNWLASYINWLKGQYNIDLNRVFVSGFSGGAESITYTLYADHSNIWTGGAAMILGGGGASGLSFGVTPTAAFKEKQLMRWFVGENDVAGATEPATWSAKDAATEGEAFYRNAGFDTALTIIPGKAHNDSEPLGPGYLNDVIGLSNTKLGYVAPAPEPEPTTGPATYRDRTTLTVIGPDATRTVGKPATAAAGDVLLLALTAYGTSAANVALPTGFTQLNKLTRTTSHTLVYGYRVVTDTEPSSYTFTAEAGNSVRADIIAVQYGDASRLSVSAITTTAAATTHAAPSVTPNTNGGMLLSFVSGGGGNAWAPPSTMIERTDAQTGASHYLSLTVATESITGTTATGTRTFTAASGSYTHIVGSVFIPSTDSA